MEQWLTSELASYARVRESGADAGEEPVDGLAGAVFGGDGHERRIIAREALSDRNRNLRFRQETEPAVEAPFAAAQGRQGTL